MHILSMPFLTQPREALINSGAQIVPQIFRQIVQRERRKVGALLGRIVQYGGKYASKMRATIYSVLP